MKRETLPLSKIVIPERFRQDYGNLSLLKDSISRYGLIQPVVLTQDKVLIAGGRRYRAHVELGLECIDVCYRETLLESERQEMEALENIVRKSFSWTEETLAIARIHRQRKREAALEGGTWNQRLACELFGVSMGALNYVLEVAKRLEAELALPPEKRPYHNTYSSCAEAYRLGVLDEQERLALAELGRRHVAIANSTLPISDVAEILETTRLSAAPDLLAEKRTQYYSNPLNPPNSFDSYWAERQKRLAESQNTIYLANRTIHANSLNWMHDHPDSVDHII